jgi:type IV pilus assembly protein PilM
MADPRKNNEDKNLLLTVGIDISERSIALVEIQDSDEKLVIESFDTLEIPQTADNENKNSSIIRFLKESFSRFPAGKHSVFSILSGSEVIIRRLSTPKMKEKDLIQAIKWDIKSHTPFPITSALIDYRSLGEVREKGVDKLDLLAVAVQKEAIDNTCLLFEAAGIKLDGVSVAPFAIWSLLKKTQLLQKDKITAFINMGSDTTKILFFNGENLEFYRELNLAGNNFTKAIANFVSSETKKPANYEEIEKIKRDYGIPVEGTTEKTPEGIPLIELLAALKPVLRRFSNEIVRSFSYYKEQFQKESIDRILISGGSSKLKNIDAFLSSELEGRVEKLDELLSPESGHNIKDEARLKENLPRLAIALGTALSKSKEINLIKKSGHGPKINVSAELNKYASVFSKIAPSTKVSTFIGVIAITALVIATLMINISVNNSISYYKKMLEEKKLTLENIKILSERRVILSKIEKEQTPIRQAIADLTNLMPSGAFLNGMSFDNAAKTVSIAGHCGNINSVAALLENIENSSFFSGSSLIEAKKSDTGNEIDFKMSFKINL